MLKTLAASLRKLPPVVLAAAGVAASAAPICDRHCDGRDAALASSDRVRVSTALFSRNIVLHFDDGDDMGWATMDNGSPGDEVWIDRSFDNGRTWASDTHLGGVFVPAGARAARTTLQNVDDWSRRLVGLLRACGKAGDRADIACTGWARTTWNAGEPRTAAATALMEFYNQDTGLFDTTGWWNSANALTALIQNIQVTGMGSYAYAIGNTYDHWVNGGTMGQFRNKFIDDTGWWGLAWIAAYDLTGDPRYLATARADADYMAGYADGACSGGYWWNNERSFKPAISTSLFIQLGAALHNRIPGDTRYLGLARDAWAWFQGTGLIDDRHLVHDGIDMTTCKTRNDTVWTYNQGVLINGLAELYRATGDQRVLDTATQIADAATTTPELNPRGILTEPCEKNNDCGADGTSFKGSFVRGLAALQKALGQPRYADYLARQAQSAYSHDHIARDDYGLHWAGPMDTADAARQQSALDLLNAAPVPH